MFSGMTIETYHVVDLPDGTTTKGQVDRRQDPAYFGLDGSSLLKGARVIDVGAFRWSLVILGRKGRSGVCSGNRCGKAI